MAALILDANLNMTWVNSTGVQDVAFTLSQKPAAYHNVLFAHHTVSIIIYDNKVNVYKIHELDENPKWECKTICMGVDTKLSLRYAKLTPIICVYDVPVLKLIHGVFIPIMDEDMELPDIDIIDDDTSYSLTTNELIVNGETINAQPIYYSTDIVIYDDGTECHVCRRSKKYTIPRNFAMPMISNA